MPARRRSAFWRSFESEAASLRRLLDEQPRRALRRVEALLAAAGYELTFDLTIDDLGRGMLVLTPENSAAVARQIDALVAAAPSVDGWVVVGRRQKKHLSDALAIVRELFDVDLARAKFAIDDAHGGLRVLLLDRRAVRWSDEHCANLVLTFLNHAIGEQTVMDLVAEVGATPDRPSTTTFGPRSLVRFFEQV